MSNEIPPWARPIKIDLSTRFPSLWEIVRRDGASPSYSDAAEREVPVRWLSKLSRLEESARKFLRADFSEERTELFFEACPRDFNAEDLQAEFPEVPEAALLIDFWSDAVEEWLVSSTPDDYECFYPPRRVALELPETAGEWAEFFSLLPSEWLVQHSEDLRVRVSRWGDLGYAEVGDVDDLDGNEDFLVTLLGEPPLPGSEPAVVEPTSRRVCRA